MTIDEAINSNVELKGELIREGWMRRSMAVQLGIEALKQTEESRKIGLPQLRHLLPGETTE